MKNITISNNKKFTFIWTGLCLGYKIAQTKMPIDPNKKRIISTVIRKLKRVSDEAENTRKLKEEPTTIELSASDILLIKEYYEQVDWNADILDEAFDIIDELICQVQN